MKKSLVFLLLLTFLINPSPVFAHAFGKLYNLPVPFWLYAFGGAGAVVVSFIVIGFFLNERKVLQYPSINISGFLIFKYLKSKLIVNSLKALSVLLFMLTVATGLFGVNNSYFNFNMTFFWIIFLLGFTYLTALLGDIYSVINPWKVIVEWFENVTGEEDTIGIFKYPESLSYWPAFAGYFLLICVELFGDTDPQKLSLLIIFYTLLIFLGVTFFGKKNTFEYFDFFGLFFKLISRVAPIQYRNGKIFLELPFTAILKAQPVKDLSLLVFIVFMLSSTAFDGFRETTPWYRFYWNNIDQFIRPILQDSSYDTFQFISLFLSPLFFLAIFLSMIFLSKILTKNSESILSLSCKFAYTLIPIALVYNIAHYYALLITSGSGIFNIISDPFGIGWNLFGTADIPINFILDTNILWHTQVALILIGHIVSVYLAHEVAFYVFHDGKKALLSQMPILILMVIYTVIGLWILSQPMSSGI